MSKSYPVKRRQRVRIKYKNVAIALAIILIITVLICAACNAGKKDSDKDKNKNDDNSGLVSGDNQNTEDPELPPLPADDDGMPNFDGDPASQLSYVFSSVNKTKDDLGVGDLVLVNNNIKFLGTVEEEDLVVVYDNKNTSYWVKDRNVKVLPKIMEPLNNMLLDFYTLYNNRNVMVRSGHRTIEYQQRLYDEELDKTGSVNSSLVAMAGYSEHHTGLVVDFTTYNGDYYKDFDGSGDYKWIMDNCYKYGFVNRYPEGKEKLTLIDNEPWHFRYVGIPHAEIMNEYGLCMEEYISFVKRYTFDGDTNNFLVKDTADGSRYLVYYVALSDADVTKVNIPLKPDPANPNDPYSWETYPYTISGNNIDGFIVTVTLVQGTKTAAPVAAAPEE